MDATASVSTLSTHTTIHQQNWSSRQTLEVTTKMMKAEKKGEQDKGKMIVDPSINHKSTKNELRDGGAASSLTHQFGLAWWQFHIESQSPFA